MNTYEETKTIRRIVAIIFILLMSFIVGGTLIAQHNKLEKNQNQQDIFLFNQ